MNKHALKNLKHNLDKYREEIFNPKWIAWADHMNELIRMAMESEEKEKDVFDLPLKDPALNRAFENKEHMEREK